MSTEREIVDAWILGMNRAALEAKRSAAETPGCPLHGTRLDLNGECDVCAAGSSGVGSTPCK